MTLFELMSACTYYQPLEIIRTNDYNENYLIAKGRKQDIINDMDDDVFRALEYKVLIIEQLETMIRVKVQDEYFFKSDHERWGEKDFYRLESIGQSPTYEDIYEMWLDSDGLEL